MMGCCQCMSKFFPNGYNVLDVGTQWQQRLNVGTFSPRDVDSSGTMSKRMEFVDS